MKVSTLLKLQEGEKYLIAEKLSFSNTYYFYILERYPYEKDDYYNENCIFHGAIQDIRESRSRVGLFVYIREEDEYPYNKYTELTGVAGSPFLSVSGHFSVYDFDFVGVYNKDTVDRTIEDYKLHDKISRRRYR